MNHSMTRRDALKAVGSMALAPAVLGAGLVTASARAQSPSTPRRRVFRLAHLTDIHVQPERKANEGLIACLHHVQNLADQPQLIITGGDSVFDAFEADNARTQLQWNLWHSIFTNECSLPVMSVIGNHDIWGWHKKRSKTTGAEPNYGKKRAIENLRLNHRYSSVNHTESGWHIVLLDSIQQPPEAGDGYRAYLDDEQFDWLERDLRDTPAEMPVLCVSHPPILSAAAVMFTGQDKNKDFVVRGSRMHQDTRRIKELFAKHPNVKLCMAGHLHHIDRVEYNGVTYMVNGAVSGNWWKGRHHDCDEGYAVIDLYNDGSFEREYVKYGWTARE